MSPKLPKISITHQECREILQQVPTPMDFNHSRRNRIHACKGVAGNKAFWNYVIPEKRKIKTQELSYTWLFSEMPDIV